MPGVVANLVSVGRLADQGVADRFYAGVCFSNLGGTDVAIVSRVGGLYYLGSALGAEVAVGLLCHATVNAQAAGELWHRRFGHIGYVNLRRLCVGEFVGGLDVPSEALSGVCKLDCAVFQTTEQVCKEDMR